LVTLKSDLFAYKYTENEKFIFKKSLFRKKPFNPAKVQNVEKVS